MQYYFQSIIEREEARNVGQPEKRQAPEACRPLESRVLGVSRASGSQAVDVDAGGGWEVG